MRVDSPLISCLCVTENRPAFMPWLQWCYERQTYPSRELVIIDSSHHIFDAGGREDIRVFRMPPGTSIACKRNQALRKARGEIITWFDDDDWQHPEKCALIVDALHGGPLYAGSCHGWFVELLSQRCTPLRGSRQILFNSGGFVKAAMTTHLFPINLPRASDTTWMRELDRRHPRRCRMIEGVLFFWLCHERNISNPARRRRFTQSLEPLKRQVGPDAWGDTDDQLQDLIERYRHEQEAPRTKASSRSSLGDREVTGPGPGAGQEDAPSRTPGSASGWPVSLVIKATVLETPFLDVMVRHMISQTRFRFQQRVVVVDRREDFMGKYADRSRSTEAELDAVLEGLIRDRVIDCVRDVDSRPETRRQILERYFSGESKRVPTHAVTGGPIYPTLFGLECVSAEFVLELDADIFFYTAGMSWVEEALGQMALDPRLWLMMTHPGPPAGLPGNSLGATNQRSATWDPEGEIWRFRHATTRYFLCDKRKLYGNLRPVWVTGGCAPLEEMFTAMLARCQAFRGALGNLRSWHLHGWSHEPPFPQLAASIAALVERGQFPPFQAGQYDLRLDRPVERFQWTTWVTGKVSRRLPNPTSGMNKQREHLDAPAPGPDRETRKAMFQSEQQEWVYQRGGYDYLASLAMVPRYATLAGYIHKLGLKRVLDIGCGRGGLVQHLHPEIEYLGIDISLTAITEASRAFADRPHTEFQVTDFRNWNCRVREFDGVVWAGIGCTWTQAGRTGNRRDWLKIIEQAEAHFASDGGCLILESVTCHWPHLEALIPDRYKLIAGCDLDCFESKESPNRCVRVLKRTAPAGSNVRVESICHNDSRPQSPFGVVIPVRDRVGQRLENTLAALEWQTIGRPEQIILVSHGSQPQNNSQLERLCDGYRVNLIKIGQPKSPWNKSLALNVGIRATSPRVLYVMTLDADIMLAPNFLEVALARLARDPPALVLCRISDLPEHVVLPVEPDQLRSQFPKLQRRASLRGPHGTGAVQTANRDFFFQVRGYDEDLLWWGAMDGDFVNRARLAGISIEWIESQTSILHQWHPRKHRVLRNPAQIEQAKLSWRRNHDLVRARSNQVQRNPGGWGEISLRSAAPTDTNASNF